ILATTCTSSLSLHDALPIFTSPIRRYADLIVHRSLAFALDRLTRQEDPKQRPIKPHHLRNLGETADHISKTERTSAEAEMDSVRSEEHTSELQSRENLVCRL